jgi:hypothetical protein
MTGKTFMNAVGSGKTDILQTFLKILEETKSPYCIIGGLAVNAYVEPVVSLDLDMVVAMEDVEEVCKAAKRKGLRVEKFEHSVNLMSPKSDLRVQLQTDMRYQEFISRCRTKQILGRWPSWRMFYRGKCGHIWINSGVRASGKKTWQTLCDSSSHIQN